MCCAHVLDATQRKINGINLRRQWCELRQSAGHWEPHFGLMYHTNQDARRHTDLTPPPNPSSQNHTFLPLSSTLVCIQRQYQFTVWDMLECRASLAPLLLSLTHEHNSRLLPLFIAVQVIKRQAAPQWQEGGEDWREGQRRVPHLHHYTARHEPHRQSCFVCTNWSVISKTFTLF